MENVKILTKPRKSTEELFDQIDDFLCHIEDYLHGEDGEDCTDSRVALTELRSRFENSIVDIVICNCRPPEPYTHMPYKCFKCSGKIYQ